MSSAIVMADSREESTARLERLPALRDALRGCSDVGSLFARAAELARAECGFERALVVVPEGDMLTARHSDVLNDEPSDLLRRQLLDAPVALVAGSAESRIVRGEPVSGGEGRSELAERLGLVHHALAVIAPERASLALLVADRAEPEVERLDRAMLAAFGAVVSLALEHQILNARFDELSHEIRHLSVGLQASIAEARRAPIQLPADGSGRSAFPLFSGMPLNEGPGARGPLTEREAIVASLLAQGRSNRDIAEHLVVSPETVKGYVARILRKLGASNRAEAVARYLRLTASS